MVGQRDICFEIKAVNSRYLDLNVKSSRLYAPLEERIKQLVSSKISRGKTDVYLTVNNVSGDGTTLTLNREYLEAYLGLMKKIGEEYDVAGQVTLEMISSKGEVFNAAKTDEDIEEVWQQVKSVAEKALASFCEMRAAEGKKLVEDIKLHMSYAQQLKEEIAASAPESVLAARERMETRIKELLEGINPDEGRLLTECAVFADKADVNEELARLDSHFSQLETMLGSKAPIGRKLDFLLQEINREINTIGSKTVGLEVTKAVIEAKSEIEKIREQIQNVE